LSAGEYKLVINGTSATLEDKKGNVEATGTVENETRRFGDTAVISNKTDGKTDLRAIEVGGTRLHVDFK
jgi:hypothetical protein